MGFISSIIGSSSSSGRRKNYSTKSGAKITQADGKVSFTHKSKTPSGTRTTTYTYKDKHAKKK